MDPITVGIVEGTGRVHAAPTLVAYGKRCFHEVGIDVDLVETGGPEDAISKVASGELDVTVRLVGLDFFLNWTPEAPMAVVADQGTLRPGRGTGTIVARTELIEQGKLRDYSDLRGKKIGLVARRGNHDWMTFAWALRRGGLTFEDAGLMSWMEAPRTKHSAKPEAVRDLLERAGPGPYLELFGRKEVPGWAVWGDQVARTLFVSGIQDA